MTGTELATRPEFRYSTGGSGQAWCQAHSRMGGLCRPRRLLPAVGMSMAHTYHRGWKRKSFHHREHRDHRAGWQGVFPIGKTPCRLPRLRRWSIHSSCRLAAAKRLNDFGVSRKHSNTPSSRSSLCGLCGLERVIERVVKKLFLQTHCPMCG